MTIPSDAYEFGGRESDVRRYQQRFIPYFMGRSPVLDIGCGRGVFLELLRDSGLHGSGLDMSATALGICQQKGFTDLHLGDVLDFLDGKQMCYGGIFCSHVIEHLNFGQAMRLLKLCYDALQPQGRLVIVTPNASDLNVISGTFWLDPTHVWLFPLPRLQSMFRETGFTVEDGGFFHVSGGSRRALPRFYFLRLLLGPYFGQENTFIVGSKPVNNG